MNLGKKKALKTLSPPNVAALPTQTPLRNHGAFFLSIPCTMHACNPFCLLLVYFKKRSVDFTRLRSIRAEGHRHNSAP